MAEIDWPVFARSLTSELFLFPTAPELAELTLRHEGVVFKASVLPRTLATFLTTLGYYKAIPLHAHAGNGITFGHIRTDAPLQDVQTTLASLESAINLCGFDSLQDNIGSLVILRCPAEWKKDLPVWGRPRGDAWLMQTVKNQLDPNHLFNPGRFLEGI